MPGVIESLSTINSLIRTLLAIIAVAAIAYGAWFGYRTYNKSDLALKAKQQELTEARAKIDSQQEMLQQKDEQIDSLHEDLKEKDKKIEQLDTAMRLLKVNHRVAWLTVLDQETDEESGDLYTTVQFVEVDDQGKAIEDPKEYRIKGDVVYLDNWVVKFDDKYVEQSDLDRSTSLVLFRRIFSESRSPQDGFPIDAVGSRPRAYGRSREPSEFEQKIWGDFWNIANDAQKAEELGIRAAHGEALSIKLQKGKSYKVQLRASDGLSITPDDGPSPVKKPAA